MSISPDNPYPATSYDVRDPDDNSPQSCGKVGPGPLRPVWRSIPHPIHSRIGAGFRESLQLLQEMVNQVVEILFRVSLLFDLLQRVDHGRMMLAAEAPPQVR